MKIVVAGLRCLFVVAVCWGMLGCAKQSSSGAQAKQVLAQQCAKNAFLQKYNCSLTEVQEAAMQHDPDAEYALGYMYYYGVGTMRDQETARIWINKAAAQGQSQAIKAIKLLAKQTFPKMGTIVTNNQSRTTQSRQVAQASNANNPSVLPATNFNQAKGQRVWHHSGSHHAANAREALPTNQQHATTTHGQNSSSVMARYYGLQLMGSRDKAIIQSFIRKQSLSSRAYVYQTTYKGLPWYVLIYDQYVDRRTANVALKELPATLASLHPWIKPLKGLKKVS